VHPGAAELRRDALSGLSPEQQQLFVDTLLAVKSNLGGDNGAARNGKRARARQS